MVCQSDSYWSLRKPLAVKITVRVPLLKPIWLPKSVCIFLNKNPIYFYKAATTIHAQFCCFDILNRLPALLKRDMHQLLNIRAYNLPFCTNIIRCYFLVASLLRHLNFPFLDAVLSSPVSKKQSILGPISLPAKCRYFTILFFKRTHFFGEALMFLFFLRFTPRNVLWGFLAIFLYINIKHYRNIQM